MRLALAQRPQRRMANQPGPRASETFLPAPTQGWDTDTPVAELPPIRARVFDNWMPRGQAIEIREGYSDHVTGGASPVETLLSYSAGGTSALFAAIGTAIYNVTSAGSLGAAAVTSLTSARWSYVNFSTSGGSFLWACNGADDPRTFDGTTWSVPALTMPGSFTDNDILYVMAFKERLFFLMKNTLTFCYLATQAISGTVSQFPLGAVFARGGRLVAAGSVSRDGGDGMDDFAVFMTSQGEIAVYQGFNPASASEWALVGVYYVGEPIGDRPLVDLGDDLGVITLAGLMSVKRVMTNVGEESAPPLTAGPPPLPSITSGWQQLAGAAQAIPGWEGVYFPKREVLIINAPITATTARQVVRYRSTKGWGRFTGWNFETFTVHGGELYAGGSDGNVYKCFDGYDDDGADITAACSWPWAMFGQPVVKTLLEARAVITQVTRAVWRAVGRGDFAETPALPAWPAVTTTNACIWGTGVWGTHLWGGENASSRQWRAILGQGHNVSLVLEARANQSLLSLNGVNLRYVLGGQV